MSNEELLARLDEKVKGLEKSFGDKLDQILDEAKKTNGRVTQNEEDINDLHIWQAEHRGQWKGIATMGAVVGAVVSGIINFLKQ